MVSSLLPLHKLWVILTLRGQCCFCAGGSAISSTSLSITSDDCWWSLEVLGGPRTTTADLIFLADVFCLASCFHTESFARCSAQVALFFFAYFLHPYCRQTGSSEDSIRDAGQVCVELSTVSCAPNKYPKVRLRHLTFAFLAIWGELSYPSFEIHHKFTTNPPQVHHNFSTFSPHLESPQLVVLFVVFYPVAKFTTSCSLRRFSGKGPWCIG